MFKKLLLLAVMAIMLAAPALAFSPTLKPTTFKASTKLGMTKMTPEPKSNQSPNAALLGVASSLAPLAAHADTVDEAQVIGLGVGLVACIVSLAVGFTIGYGTLTKL
ncbi:hypothetical protein TrVE_jg4158 [Triparma verrucosa]|uniref:Uncharacterized protein n=2 Tax=Triparma TaxID=722752 RepID=A0A9W6ZUU2_9STRA|nr:hypothetical protein TrST_g5238 [Triparma strigata]GMH90471.1 hypothetical protein TrVE_jg4158 [Triparma verrucosa]|mmetsp:Transcript_4111/g.7696  ORF Transcript_4111/g.7696 Transcript_4111/m.7696 type:complete len:107 (+) Transcript_4111:44-364(+)|eukprot:CAMPEP_0182493374 /NCGR_PEP_ID=MMETSP1321-20130603/2334_1 /TAXON_ID=91990 /ORGANISM="Bolidomonas sp., Strain RCC1657" /LENGTH=106 /DNA_ID=CAMNT_0024696109 /DNA_START=295 /DNA_END=615 /DNA_ORIENTATION=-